MYLEVWSRRLEKIQVTSLAIVKLSMSHTIMTISCKLKLLNILLAGVNPVLLSRS